MISWRNALSIKNYKRVNNASIKKAALGDNFTTSANISWKLIVSTKSNLDLKYSLLYITWWYNNFDITRWYNNFENFYQLQAVSVEFSTWVWFFKFHKIQTTAFSHKIFRSTSFPSHNCPRSWINVFGVMRKRNVPIILDLILDDLIYCVW